MVLFKEQDPGADFKTTLENSPALLAALDTQELSSQQKNALQAGPGWVRYAWTYTFSKPDAEKVARLATALVESVKPLATPLDGHCESCHGFSTTDLILYNGVPAYICNGCQERIRMEAGGAAAAYENLPSDFPRGLFFGLAAAVAGSVAWGLFVYALHRVWLYAAILIGWGVGRAVVMGMGKVNLAGKALMFALTLGSVLFGDAIFFTLAVMKETNSPFSLEVLKAVLVNFVELEKESGGGAASVLFGLGGALFVLYSVRKPSFEVKFERLGQPAVE
jgi:hypothetical protein